MKRRTVVGELTSGLLVPPVILVLPTPANWATEACTRELQTQLSRKAENLRDIPLRSPIWVPESGQATCIPGEKAQWKIEVSLM